MASALEPSLQNIRFADQDHLASLLRGGSSEFLQRRDGAFQGEFTFAGLESVTLQYGRMDLPYISMGSPSGDRPSFILHLKPQPEYLWKGRRLDPRSIVGVFAGGEHQDLNPPHTYWVVVSVDRPVMERALAAIGEGSPGLNSRGSQVFLPEPGSFDALRCRLKAVHGALLADPSTLAVPEAKRGIEESVVSTLAAALGSASPVRAAKCGAAARTRVARQVEAYLSSVPGEPLSLADLCAVAGVSERTLRNIFHERYGMSPVQYLKVRRLHQARKALKRADPDRNTVRSIANRCGIWHLGRFSSEYRTLFDEAPLETLRRAGFAGEAWRRNGHDSPSSFSWLLGRRVP